MAAQHVRQHNTTRGIVELVPHWPYEYTDYLPVQR